MKYGTRFWQLLALGVLMLFIPVSSRAQWNYYVAVQAAQDANPLELYSAPASSAIGVDAGFSRTGNQFSSSYSGQYVYYNELPILTGFAHQANASLLVGEATTLSFLAGQRLGIEDHFYDYSHLNLALGHKFSCLGLSCTVQGSAAQLRFSELTERDQRSVRALIRASKSFQTGTTFIATLGTGYTSYSIVLPETQKHPDVAKLEIGLRFAQSLTPTTGIALQLKARMLEGETSSAYLQNENGLSYSLLDDPSLYEARIAGIELTQVLLDHSLQLKAGAYHTRRTYLTQGIYTDADTYNQAALREDLHYTTWLSVAWTFLISGQAMTAEMGLQWTDNQSNSYWYSFDSRYLSVGLSYQL